MLKQSLLACFSLMILAAAMINTGTVRAEDKSGDVPAVLKFKMKNLAGEEVDLAKYQGKVVLFVNVASRCGYTPQYEGLQALHEKYKDKGLVIVGVPCNQFGAQEPGTSTEIAEFCKANYGVTFDLLEKVDVNGDSQCDLYKHLTSKETNPKSAGKVKWNFEKFLIGRDGAIAGRFGSGVSPDSAELIKAVEEALGK